jgi:hypothetical protein
VHAAGRNNVTSQALHLLMIQELAQAAAVEAPAAPEALRAPEAAPAEKGKEETSG